MEVDRKDLMNKLLLVRPGLGKREIVEHSTYFVFTGKFVCTYNDQISIRCTFDSDFECAVEANKFYSLLQNMDDDKIDISLEENQLLISSADTRSGFSIVKDSNIYDLLKSLDIDKKQKWIKLPKNFIEGLLLSSFSISKDVYDGAFNCACVKDDHIYSTDNLRVSSFIMDSSIKDSILFSLNSIKEMIKYSILKMSIGKDNWIYLATDDDLFFCVKRQNGDFPIDEIETLFNNEGIQIEFPAKMIDLIKTVSSIAVDIDDMDKRMMITIKKNKIVCRVDGNSNWAERELKIDYKNKDEIKFSINPLFLSQILDKNRNAIVNIEEGSILFATDEFKHIIKLESEE